MTIEGGRFRPHVMLVRTGQTLLIDNHDPVSHNATIPFRKNRLSSRVIPADREQRCEVRAQERLAVSVECHIHPWMNAFVLVRDSPYMATTDAEGRFRIENLPVGEHTFVVWHERAGYLSDAPFDEGARVAERGRLTVTIAAGENDLGAALLAPKRFK